MRRGEHTTREPSAQGKVCGSLHTGLALALCFGLLLPLVSAHPALGRARDAGKKKAPPTLPANGTYSGGTNDISIEVSTKRGKRYQGKRFVVASAMVPLTSCNGQPLSPAGGFLLRTPVTPIVGRRFTVTSDQASPNGYTAVSGTFLSAKRVHLTARLVNWRPVAGGNACSGALDVTTTLRIG